MFPGRAIDFFLKQQLRLMLAFVDKTDGIRDTAETLNSEERGKCIRYKTQIPQ